MRLMLIPVTLGMMALPHASHASDLLDAYANARSNDPILSRSDAIRLAAGEDIALARSALLPKITAKIGFSEKEAASSHASAIVGATQARHTRTRNDSVLLEQAVFNASSYAGLKAARSSSHAQNATYETALQQLVARVATAYFRVLTNDDALTFAKADEQALARQFEQACLRFDAGLSAFTDVQDARAQHDTAVATLITAENTLADSREALTQITGKPADNLKKLREQLPRDAPSPNDPRAWVAKAVRSNPSILAAQFNVESRDHSVSSARAGHLPTIHLTAGYSKTTLWGHSGISRGPVIRPNNNRRGGATVRLTLRVPIFSGAAAQSRVRQSIYQRDAARDALEGVRRQVVRDTLKYYRSAQAGVGKIEATRSAIEASRLAREATQAGFDVGTHTIVDVLIAQRKLTSALNEDSQARHQYVLDTLLLKQAAGTVGLRDLEAINALLR